MTQKQKIVYACMVLDNLHHGHINILNEAAKHGKVLLAIIKDRGVAEYKRIPTIPFEKRMTIAKSLKNVWKVVPQEKLDFIENLNKYKPDIVINGDDWKLPSSRQTRARQRVIEWLEAHNGTLIEVPYTQGISSSIIIEDKYGRGVTPERRLSALRRLIEIKPLVRVLEAHNGLSGLVAENTKLGHQEFDAMWESSLCDSASKGKPDIELVDFTSRVQIIEEILEVTTKPLIIDLDTGGQTDHFCFMIKTLERLGVSAVIIEDKKFPKINSLMPGAKHTQEEVDVFCEKISAGKKAQVTEDFMLIARVESLISNKSLDDGLIRARAYINAGADAIMIHSKERDAENILTFCKQYKKFHRRVPLVLVPTTYNTLTEKKMIDTGVVNIVIYANHPLRSAYKAMKQVAETILEYKRGYEAEQYCVPVKEIFELTNKI